MTILQAILDYKATLIPSLLAHEPVFEVKRKSHTSLYETLRKTDTLQVIAEMKRASPSKGPINVGANPVEQAKVYERAGASCISVLTEDKYFKGSFQDLADIANCVDIPILNKDFIVHEIQIDYAKAAGASVILLIVAALPDEKLKAFYTYASVLGLDVLVEVHNEEELDRALAIHPKIIGVNNRDLKTFNVNLAQTEKLATKLSAYEDIAFISESGIWNAEDAARAARTGARGVLVGESLMVSENIEQALRELQVPLPSLVKDVK